MATRARHYGLDWLRIAAFALLILYHVGMVFAPWPWVVKAPETWPWLIVPMALMSPWRLAVLFAVSGYAARTLFDKGRDPAGFLRARSVRLLLPVAFAMLLLIPPEIWVRARIAGYGGDLPTFWLHDYWRTDTPWGGFPQWEHLWFLVYLWGYTVVLTGLIAAFGTARIDALAARWLGGGRIVWLPIVVIVLMKWATMFVIPERSGLFVDWTAHLAYFPLILLGFTLPGDARLWPAVLGCWRSAVPVALVSGAVVLGFELTYQGGAEPGHGAMMIDRAARIAMGWAMVLLVLGAAQRWANRDHPWRATLAEAVFPLYLFHQSAIVLIAWFTLGWGWPPALEAALLILGTVTIAAGFYLLGRRIDWLRPLIGLSPRARPRAAEPLPAV